MRRRPPLSQPEHGSDVDLLQLIGQAGSAHRRWSPDAPLVTRTDRLEKAHIPGLRLCSWPIASHELNELNADHPLQRTFTWNGHPVARSDGHERQEQHWYEAAMIPVVALDGARIGLARVPAPGQTRRLFRPANQPAKLRALRVTWRDQTWIAAWHPLFKAPHIAMWCVGDAPNSEPVVCLAVHTRSHRDVPTVSWSPQARAVDLIVAVSVLGRVSKDVFGVSRLEAAADLF